MKIFHLFPTIRPKWLPCWSSNQMDYLAPYIKHEMIDTTINSSKVILLKSHSSKDEKTSPTNIQTVAKPKYKELKDNWVVTEFYDANINSRKVIMTKIEPSAVKVDLKEMMNAYDEEKETEPSSVKEEYVENNFHMDLEKTLTACKEETISVKQEIKGGQETANSVKEEYVENNFLDDLEKVLKVCEEEANCIKKETKCEQEPESAVKEEYVENNFHDNLVEILKTSENAFVFKSEKETHETKQTEKTPVDNQETADANKTKAGKEVVERTPKLSAYEQVREGNIREREAMLAQIQGELGMLKQDLLGPVARRTYRKRKVVEEVRRSSRLRGQDCGLA